MKKLFICLSIMSQLGCKTLDANRQEGSIIKEFDQSSVDQVQKIENDKVRELWAAHIEYETKTMNTSGRDVQPDCKPRFYPASSSVERQGIVMFFHGFTACPQQYFVIAAQLASRGYDVFLPLMPGQGRSPNGAKDHLTDLPLKRTVDKFMKHPRLIEFVEKMNEIASASTGVKVVAGLSGGGGLATGAAVEGQGETKNIWDRVLLYAPYYQNNGAAKTLADVVAMFSPGTSSDWGDSCRANRSRPNGRNGYCSVPAGGSQAMAHYGEEVALSADKIKIPVQIVGVEKDPTADNRSIKRAFDRMDNASFCFYPLGVPHSIIAPNRDLLPDTAEYETIRDLKTPSGPPYEWVPSMEEDTIRFITEGLWFPVEGITVIESAYGIEIPMCRPSKLTR